MSKASVALPPTVPKNVCSDLPHAILDLEPGSLEDAIVSVRVGTELLERTIGGMVLECEHSMPNEEMLRMLHHLAGEVRVLADHSATFYQERDGQRHNGMGDNEALKTLSTSWISKALIVLGDIVDHHSTTVKDLRAHLKDLDVIRIILRRYVESAVKQARREARRSRR